MSKGQRTIAFIFSLIIGGLLIFHSYNEAHELMRTHSFNFEAFGIRISEKPGLFLTYLVKQPTLYIGIAVIGIGTFIFKGGKQ